VLSVGCNLPSVARLVLLAVIRNVRDLLNSQVYRIYNRMVLASVLHCYDELLCVRGRRSVLI